jgi:hypothetical protein
MHSGGIRHCEKSGLKSGKQGERKRNHCGKQPVPRYRRSGSVHGARIVTNSALLSISPRSMGC